MNKYTHNKSIKRYFGLYAMLAVPLVYLLVFKYIPILGNIIAFREYSVKSPVLGISWSGFKYFEMFLTDINFYIRLKNTLILSFENLIIGFPVPIIFALLLNELKNTTTKKFVQTVSYLPHFISTVIVIGFVTELLSPTGGLVNDLRSMVGMEKINFIAKPEYFRPIYIFSEIWQHMGWNAIIYISALSGVDTQLYEAATIDGANKFKQVIYVTIPGIMPTIVVMLILSVGNILSIGYEKVLLLMNDLNRETADVISTYVYRMGIVGGNYSYSTAIDLFNGVSGLLLVSIANHISKKVSDTALW